MSLNWVMLTQDGKSPIPLPQEKMFFTQSDVKLVLDCNENEGGYPGHSDGYFESNKGTVILSNQRIIYLAESPTDQFKNLNIPILNLKKWKLEQPWFGANYISGAVFPVQGGGLTRISQLKLTFNEGGAIEFTTILRSLLERMGESNSIPAEYEPLPAYQSGANYNQQESSSSTPDDLPPHYSA